MAATRVHPLIGRVRPGQILPLLDERGLTLWLRLSDDELLELPSIVILDVKLGAWDFEKAVAALLMVRLDKERRHTYRHWIDTSTTSGLRNIQNLARQRQVVVRPFSEHNERILRTRNSVALRCHRVVAAIAERKVWAPDVFAECVRQLESQHRTPCDLWLAIRNQAFPF